MYSQFQKETGKIQGNNINVNVNSNTKKKSLYRLRISVNS
jgi:hypothetical protein